MSLDELTADAAAPGVRAACVAWLLLSAEPGGGLRIELLRLEAGQRSQVFDVPLLIERQPLPLAGVDNVRGGAVLLDAVAGVVTIRYATGADDLFRPRRNLLNTSTFRVVDTDWLIRIPGEFFAELVHRGLDDALTPPPRGVTTEEEATTVWAHPVNDNWGVVGHVGIEQKDACADVDLSVDIGVTLNIFSRVDPGEIPNSVDLELRLWSDTSDWDTFRCWAATSLAGGPVALAAIAEYIRVEVGTTVTESEVGNGFIEVDNDSTSVTYQRTLPLPVFPAGNPLGMEVGPDGLVVHGKATLLRLTREVTFEPAGSVLSSEWKGKFSCGSGWRQQYTVASVVVRDQGRSGTVVAADIPVRIFPTTKFEPVPEFLAQPPADEWSYSTPFFTSPSAVITPHRTGEPRLREAVMFFLHTSAGLRRFDIGPIGRRTESDPEMLKIREKGCRIVLRDTPQLEELKWVEEPPRYNYGSNPLRQWMLTFRSLPRHANVVLHARGQSEEVSHHYQFREGAYSGVLELVTDADVELVLEHDLGDTDAEFRINQRWLLPTRTVPLPGPAEGISLARMGKSGGRVLAVHVNGRSLALGSDKLTEWTGLPFARAAREQKSLSVSLRNGQMAVIVGCSLIIAVPLDVKEPEKQFGKRYAPSTYSEPRLSTK